MALGCATLAFAEGLLRMSDVGAARNQLEVVATGNACHADWLSSHARCSRRSRSALGEATWPSTLAGGAARERRLGRRGSVSAASLIGLLLGKIVAWRWPCSTICRRALRKKDRPTLGTVGRLYSVLSAISYSCPLSLAATIQLRRDLAWLLKRHASAAWCLLLLSIISGALVCSDETCEGYDILVQSAAELRCRYMDGVADLLDRQLCHPARTARARWFRAGGSRSPATTTTACQQRLRSVAHNISVLSVERL